MHLRPESVSMRFCGAVIGMIFTIIYCPIFNEAQCVPSNCQTGEFFDANASLCLQCPVGHLYESDSFCGSKSFPCHIVEREILACCRWKCQNMRLIVRFNVINA